MSSASNTKFSVQNLFNVEGWVVVVSGGGTGIGLMISQAFANNGATVYITSRRQDVLDNAVKSWGSNLAHPKGKMIAIVSDVTSKESLLNLAKEVEKMEKSVDLLVNAAGINKGKAEVEKGDEDAKQLQQELWAEEQKEWSDVYETNVTSYFFTTVAFLPLLSAASHARANHTASVINISSMSGITRGTQAQFKYNVSKAATIHLNTLLAQELRRKAIKVRVNSIAPGYFPSEMTTDGSDENNKSKIPIGEGEDYGAKKGVPAGRPGNEQDMAQVALMLACNEYAYGQTVAIEGGYLLEHP